MTGLQEVTKFQKHLSTCKKHPNRQDCSVCSGTKKVVCEGFETATEKCWKCNGTGKMNPRSNLNEALEVRAESGQ